MMIKINIKMANKMYLNEADLWGFYTGTPLYRAANRQGGRHFGVKISYNRAILHFGKGC